MFGEGGGKSRRQIMGIRLDYKGEGIMSSSREIGGEKGDNFSRDHQKPQI